MRLSEIPTEIERLAEDCEAELAGRFAEIDRTARANTRLKAASGTDTVPM